MTSSQDRRAIMARVSADYDGVAHRKVLAAYGLTRHDLRTEVRSGHWTMHGRHTIAPGPVLPAGRAHLWRAVWESGAGAALDGVAALLAAGLRGFEPTVLDVIMPARNRSHAVPGVRLRQVHSSIIKTGVGLPRVPPESATIRAAQLAVSDRQAAFLICPPVQQRLVRPAALLDAWNNVIRTPRREFLTQVIHDVCDSAQSLGELDFAKLCRRHGLPPPTRQVMRRRPGGRMYLDVAWEHRGLAVEIDGIHHDTDPYTIINDALTRNEVAAGGIRVLRIPVLGLRLEPDAFMEQVKRAHWG